MNSFEADKIQSMAESMINTHLDGWKFDWNNRRRAYGVCNYSKKTIYLSRFLCDINDIEEINDTLLHEIAHGLAPGDGHGSRWRRIFIGLGGSGKRTSDLSNKLKKKSQKSAKWLVVIKGTNEVIRHCFRKPSVDFSNRFVRGRRGETLGKMVVVASSDFYNVSKPKPTMTKITDPNTEFEQLDLFG